MNDAAAQLNWLDYLLLFILASSLIASLVRGFAREIAGLVALVLGVLLGMWFHGAVGAWLLPYVSSPDIADWLGFAAIFFGVTTLGALVGYVIAKMLSVAGLSLFDRLVGGAFGLLKGALLGAILVFAILAFSPKGPPQSVSGSVVTPYVTWTVDVLAAMAPRELKDVVDQNIAVLRGLWDQVPSGVPGLPGTEAPVRSPQPADPQTPPAVKPREKPSPNKAGLGPGGAGESFPGAAYFRGTLGLPGKPGHGERG